MGKKKKAKAKAKEAEQAMNKVLKQAHDFGDKAREVVSRVIGDKEFDREALSDQAKSTIKEAAQLVKEAALLVKDAAVIVKEDTIKSDSEHKHDEEHKHDTE
jgi:hypothetical protein